jgi:opacity protein-like surface antigen
MRSICRLAAAPLCAAALALPPVAAPARAQEPAASTTPDVNSKGFYATLGAGAAWPQNLNGSTSVFGVNVSGNYSLNGGFALETGLGYDFGTVRGELTYLYDNASLNTLSVTALGSSGTASISNGNVNTNSVLASAYVDIPTGSRWVPYLGGGLGYTNIGWGAFTARANNVTVGFNSGNQSALGYQGKVGLSYLASKTTDLFVEGTYQGTTGFTVDSVNYDPLSSWGARIGARYRF